VRALAATGRFELLAFVREDVDLGVPTRDVRSPLALGWEQLELPVASRSLDAVVTLTERLPVLGGPPLVVWLFELPTHRIEENKRTRARAYQRASDALTSVLWKRSLRGAARVLAGSRATARELRAAVPELGDVRVLYPGLDPVFSPGEGAEGRYVLHLGSADPRDNLDGVLDAFEVARARAPRPIRLVVAGSVEPREREGVEFAGRVSDEELLRLYRGAAAYLDATLYEGFGYQPLEAMACGAPVVASTASSIPEVVGEAGLLADPRDPHELGEALARVLEEPGLADRLRARGLEQARRFTWERTARELADVLDEVVA
jgi:glycosyltransferase involved in cell wall biosynthesis